LIDSLLWFVKILKKPAVNTMYADSQRLSCSQKYCREHLRMNFREHLMFL